MPARRLRAPGRVVDDESLAYLPRSLALLLLLLVASCGGGGGSSDAEEAASVSISSPADGATVASPFQVTMTADGFALEPAGAVREGAGHFHLIVDADCIPAGEQIPTDESHVHLADGTSETELALPAGEHAICLQAGDGQHTALDLTDEITITVGGGGETTTETEEGAALEDWQGTYEGEVVWDCGAAGTHRGTLSADVLVLTYEGGLATLDAEHTVSGSCADTGSLTISIHVEGQRTASGFTFPSTLWGVPGSFSLGVSGDTASGTLSGAVPGPATITMDFDLECTYGC
jgi:Domain of unknown function (DUF4399)